MFTVMYGKQTFGDVTDMVSVFGFGLSSGVCWADKLPIATCGFRKAATTTTSLASTDGYRDHGTWYQASFAFSSEPIAVCIMMTRRVKGVIRAGCAMHVIPDESAGHIVINAPLSPNRLSRFGDQIQAFVGCGYVVGYNDLKRLGIKIVKSDKSAYFDQEEIDDEFTVIGSSAKNALPEVMRVPVSDTETKVVFVKPAATRRLRVRPK